jgi:drug/metabolite transporter (DMT)-like permease
MAVVFALLAALSNAVSVATQHMASTAGPRRSSGWRLVQYLFRNPLWLFGWVALAGAFLFQALALHDGLVSVVQPLLVTELVFALALRRFWIHQSIRPITWVAAALTCAGLAVFILAGEPEGGHPTPTSQHWLVGVNIPATPNWLSVSVVALMMVASSAQMSAAAAAQRGSPGWRAALYASAAALIWALEATIIKATTDTLSQFGVAGMFTRWPVYALAVGGAAGTFLQQVALHVGPLRVSQPFLVIVDPIVSIALSVWLFDERFKPDAAVLALAAVAFAVMCTGVVFLTQTAPATMKPDPGE